MAIFSNKCLMKMSKPNPKLNKWIRWQKNISSDLVRLHGSKAIYYEYIRIINDNVSIKNGGLAFHNWVVDNWVTFTAMTIRRQAEDNDWYKDTVSLAKLIKDIRDYPECLTRAFHVSLYSKSIIDFSKGIGDATFTEHAGTGDYFDSKIADSDLAKLHKVSKKVQVLATRSIAHSSKKPLPKLTFDEVDQCIETFKELTQKYVLLLTAGWNVIEPIQDYWQGIFTRAWISKDKL